MALPRSSIEALAARIFQRGDWYFRLTQGRLQLWESYSLWAGSGLRDTPGSLVGKKLCEEPVPSSLEAVLQEARHALVGSEVETLWQALAGLRAKAIFEETYVSPEDLEFFWDYVGFVLVRKPPEVEPGGRLDFWLFTSDEGFEDVRRSRKLWLSALPRLQLRGSHLVWYLSGQEFGSVDVDPHLPSRRVWPREHWSFLFRQSSNAPRPEGFDERGRLQPAWRQEQDRRLQELARGPREAYRAGLLRLYEELQGRGQTQVELSLLYQLEGLSPPWPPVMGRGPMALAARKQPHQPAHWLRAAGEHRRSGDSLQALDALLMAVAQGDGDPSTAEQASELALALGFQRLSQLLQLPGNQWRANEPLATASPDQLEEYLPELSTAIGEGLAAAAPALMTKLPSTMAEGALGAALEGVGQSHAHGRAAAFARGALNVAANPRLAWLEPVLAGAPLDTLLLALDHAMTSSRDHSQRADREQIESWARAIMRGLPQATLGELRQRWPQYEFESPEAFERLHARWSLELVLCLSFAGYLQSHSLEACSHALSRLPIAPETAAKATHRLWVWLLAQAREEPRSAR